MTNQKKSPEEISAKVLDDHTDLFGGEWYIFKKDLEKRIADAITSERSEIERLEKALKIISEFGKRNLNYSDIQECANEALGLKP